MTAEERFNEFHKANPRVYTLFKTYAYQLLKAGHKRLSSKAIIERIRWESMVSTTGSGWHVTAGKPFLINNNFTAWYARRFIADFPMHAGKLETREIRAP